MWSIGYDQVLDEPPSSPSILTLAEDRSRVPSISQPSPIKLQSNTGQISIDSDPESDEGEGKTPTTPFQTVLSPQIDRSFDDDGELNINKDTLGIPSTSSLNSPTGSDKFIVVTDVEILEAKNASEPQIKSTYLDLKEGSIKISKKNLLLSLLVFFSQRF
jgi:hypothetical protein